MQDSESNNAILNELSVWIASAVVGGMTTHFWYRFRTRTAVLRYEVSSFRVGTSQEDLFGKLQVIYNGKEVNNLHFLDFNIVNESSRDLENLILNFRSRSECAIHIAHGMVENSANPLQFAEPYVGAAGALNQIAKLDSASPEHTTLVRTCMTTRDFSIPVLNRYQRVMVGMTVQSLDASPPEILISCDHIGVKISHNKPALRVFGVGVQKAAIVGCVIGLAASAGFWVYAVEPRFALPLVFAMGAFVLFMGAGVVRVGRSLVRIFS